MSDYLKAIEARYGKIPTPIYRDAQFFDEHGQRPVFPEVAVRRTAMWTSLGSYRWAVLVNTDGFLREATNGMAATMTKRERQAIWGDHLQEIVDRVRMEHAL